MRHPLIKALAISGLLLSGLTATAQDDQARIFDGVRADLDRAHEDATPFSPDRDRVTIAMQLVNRCQRAVMGGDYDRYLFNQTVASIQRVVDLNRLSDESRGYLSDDVRMMTRLQARLEGYDRDKASELVKTTARQLYVKMRSLKTIGLSDIGSKSALVRVRLFGPSPDGTISEVRKGKFR